jgi:UDP-N-acetylmuramate--alanine ligase
VLRTAAEIAAGLAPARLARPIAPGEVIHVVGAAGAGASAAARLAAAAGAIVTGCDSGGPSPYTVALEAVGISVAAGHDPAHVAAAIPRPSRLAVTKALTSVEPDHPELAAARALGIPLEAWQQVVADAAAGRTLLAVTGTHGKSTTAGWLVDLLVRAGLDPLAFVGALLPPALTGGPPSTARVGAGPLAVVEADEYAGNFDPYRPELAVVTNVEWDHPDVFPDRAGVVAAIEAWLRRAAAAGPTRAVVNVGDPGGAELAGRLDDWPGRLVAVALTAEGTPVGVEAVAAALAARYRTRAGPAVAVAAGLEASTATGSRLVVAGLPGADGPLRLRVGLVGRHNAANGLLVAAAAAALGVSRDLVAAGLAEYAGVGRRLERLGEVSGVVVYDDYAHHPTAIAATLDAVRQREPGRRVWAVYEPLTFHRTAAMLDAFAAVLATADAGVAVADIWPGRDPDRTIASADALAAAVAARAPGRVVGAPGSVEATAAWLAERVRPGDLVLVMGGGRSYQIGRLLLATLTDRTRSRPADEAG